MFLLYPNDVVAERVASGRGTGAVWAGGALMFVVPLVAIMAMQLRKMRMEQLSVNDAVKYLKEQEAARKQALVMANWFIALSFFCGNFFIRLIFYRFWDPQHDLFFDVVASVLSVTWCGVVALESLHTGPSRFTAIVLTVANLLHVVLARLLWAALRLVSSRALLGPAAVASVLALVLVLATGLVPALVCNLCYDHADRIKALEVALATRAFSAVLTLSHSSRAQTQTRLAVRADSTGGAAISGLVQQLPCSKYLRRNVCLSVKVGDAAPRHQPQATYNPALDCFAFPPVELSADDVAALARGTPCSLLLVLRDKPTGLVVSDVLHELVLEESPAAVAAAAGVSGTAQEDS